MVGMNLATFSLALLVIAPPEGDAVSPAQGSKLRTQILDTWRAELKKPMHGKTFKFVVRNIKVQGDWAFVEAEVRNPKLGPMDWKGTDFALQASEGMMDQLSYALLTKKKNKWSVRVMSIGSTDVPWVEWPNEYKAPKAIFPFS